MKTNNPQFSSKHYNAIAAILRTRIAQIKNSPASNGVRLTALDLASAFSDDNPRFDSKRFLEAAGATFYAPPARRQPLPDTGERTPRSGAIAPSGSPFARIY